MTRTYFYRKTKKYISMQIMDEPISKCNISNKGARHN